VLLFFISCSSIAYAPVFWAVAGASGADIIGDKLPLAEKAEKKAASDKKTENEKKPASKSGKKPNRKK
jgi:hypothetical protein